MKRITSLYLILIIVGTLSSCGKKEEPKIEQVRSICQLSTVKVYYNNVAKSIKQSGKSIWNVLEKDREFWIEYDGVAEVGIDMDEVKMEVRGDEVCITIPEAELLSTRIVRETFDESCYITSSDNWWDHNKITTEDQQGAINMAQAEMRETVKKDKNLFVRAEKIAKETIQNYFNKLNAITGSKFEIKWE